ncbi:hypothetical protein DXD76_10080 [Firmicutes bacterium TM09-10]|nr:hypothetical protein DXD76_10080 [Firmicutes bacterium TM09-10]
MKFGSGKEKRPGVKSFESKKGSAPVLVPQIFVLGQWNTSGTCIFRFCGLFFQMRHHTDE